MGEKKILENNVTYKIAYETGWGVTFFPHDNTHINEDDELIEDETVIKINSIIVEINENTVEAIGDKVYVKIPDFSTYDCDFSIHFAVKGFKRHEKMFAGDTHDLRSYLFDTKKEAEEHVKNTVKRFENPEPWECFVKHDYFKFVK